MTIASLPPFFNMNVTDDKGNFTPDGYLYNDQLWQSLNQLVILINNHITDNGITFSSFTTSQIIALEPSSAVGTVWFNSTLSKLQVKTGTGIIETITSV